MPSIRSVPDQDLSLLPCKQELAHVQSTHQALDQQFNQTKTKMSQEIQQMKKEANIHQSDIDKVLTHYTGGCRIHRGLFSHAPQFKI